MINKIVVELNSSEDLRILAKKITNNSDFWEDLFQDVLVNLIEKKAYTLEVYNKDGLSGVKNYFIGCLYNEWNMRVRLKSNSRLILIADNHHVWSEYKERLLPDNTIRTQQKAVSELKKKIASGEENEGANLLWRACHSNIHTVSKEEGTSFYQIKRRITPIIKEIKRKLDE